MGPVYFGPIEDVPNVGDMDPYRLSNNLLFVRHATSTIKQQQPGQNLDSEQWPDGLPIQSTYSEWEQGPYNREGTPCQHCPMPANTELNNSVDISTMQEQSITFGFPREPEDIRRHLFRGPLDDLQGEPRLIDKAAYISLSMTQSDNLLSAEVSVSNIGCGHALPTGEPMRSVVLLVEAECEDGRSLAQISGPTITDRGGHYAIGAEGDAIGAGPALTTIAVAQDGLSIDWPGIGQAITSTQGGSRQLVLRQVRFGQYLEHNGIALPIACLLSVVCWPNHCCRAR